METIRKCKKLKNHEKLHETARMCKKLKKSATNYEKVLEAMIIVFWIKYGRFGKVCVAYDVFNVLSREWVNDGPHHFTAHGLNGVYQSQ